MEQDVSYTTEEIAKLLKISKLTVYDLIKKGDLPAFRVGKQMRVDGKDLEAYKQRAKSGPGEIAPSAAVTASNGRTAAAARPRETPPGAAQASYSAPASAEPNADAATAFLRRPQPPAEAVTAAPRSFPAGDAVRPIVITGQDASLDLLANRLEKRVPGFRPLRAYVGSMDSLIALYRGESDIVSTHLLDGDSGEYNLPYIRRLLSGFSYVVVNLVARSAGLYTAPGNPLGLTAWTDLGSPGLRLVNREKGSGARVLLDEQLRLHGIDRARLVGYESEETSHLAVAAKVMAGDADVGVGIEKAAAMVGVGFVPLIQERYDLVMLKTAATAPWLDAALELLRDSAFRQELASLQGYDASHTGRIWLET